MGTSEIRGLSNLACDAILFLYRKVLHREIGPVDHAHAKTPVRVPLVLSAQEVRAVLEHLTGVPRLVCTLLYGLGLRLQECLELRVKDIDFDRQEIVVRRGKGQKDRRVMLPEAAADGLRAHLEAVRSIHRAELAAGLGAVVLPEALRRKFPSAPTEWRWQFVFPAGRIYRDPRYGPPTRFHLHETAVQRTVAAAGLWYLQARELPYVPTFVRHSSARGWI